MPILKIDRNIERIKNLVGDLQRAIMFYAQDPAPSYQNCLWLKNITRDLPDLSKIDPKLREFIDLTYLRSDSDPPLIKAEKLLMMSQRLQQYLFN